MAPVAEEQEFSRDSEAQLLTPSINVEALINETVRIRLPRLDEAGDLVPSAKPKKGSAKRGARLAAATRLAALRAELSSLRPRCPPTREDLKSAMKRYFPDLLVQLTYIGGAFAVYSSTTQRVASSSASTALRYWTLLAGIVSGCLLVVKTVRSFADRLFDLVDTVEDKINAAIDMLQKELEEDVAEMIQEALEGTSDFVQSAVSSEVVGKLSDGIDEAQKSLDARSLLPFPLGSRARFAMVFTPAGCSIVVLKAAWSFIQGPSGVASRRLSADPAGFGSEARPLIVNAVINAIWSAIAAWPFIRFAANNALNFLQRHATDFLQSSVRGSIPGGVDNLQKVLDALTGGAGALASLRGGLACMPAAGCALQ